MAPGREEKDNLKKIIVKMQLQNLLMSLFNCNLGRKGSFLKASFDFSHRKNVFTRRFKKVFTLVDVKVFVDFVIFENGNPVNIFMGESLGAQFSFSCLPPSVNSGNN